MSLMLLPFLKRQHSFIPTIVKFLSRILSCQQKFPFTFTLLRGYIGLSFSDIANNLK